MVCFKGICDEMFYGVRKHVLFITYLADLVFIGLSVFTFDELEFLSSYDTWKNALFSFAALNFTVQSLLFIAAQRLF